MSRLLTIQKDVRYLLEGITYQVLETLAQGDMLAQTIMEQSAKKVVHQSEMQCRCWREESLKIVLTPSVERNH
jgi:hypothetical protein